MNRMVESRHRGDNPRYIRRRVQKKEEEIIRVPAFDNSDLIAKFKLTLVGRMFHSDGRSVEALLKHMPKRRIWDVEGRVRGTNLGNNKFQFDFDKEEDLQKVLQRRPCHFNKWSFSLEQWIPTIKEDFPNTLALWASVSGIPIHYKKWETYESIGKALGSFDTADVEGGRVRVIINGDMPLKFECKVGFDNGDVVKALIIYEDLHRHCFTCKRISHEEGTCPELSPEQREANRILRLEQKEKEELAAIEAFSAPARGFENHAGFDIQTRYPREVHLERKTSRFQAKRNEISSSDRAFGSEHGDLRDRISNRRDNLAKNVWNRLDQSPTGKESRGRERFHPYHKDRRELPKFTRKGSESLSYRGRYGDSASSSSWRVK